jgi:tetratricopeptide (TPR) repeat protein
MNYDKFASALIIAAQLSLGSLATAEAQSSEAMNACLWRGGVTLDQRIAACTSIIESQTETTEALALAFGNRGVARNLKKDIEGARKDLEQSIRLDSASASSHRFRGNLYLSNRDEQKASEEFRKAIEIDPKLGPAYANLGMMAARRGTATSAVEYLDKSIALDPANPLAYLARGGARIQLEAYDLAIEDFTKALNAPEPEYAFFGRGSAFAHKGEHEKALADYNEGLRLNDKSGGPFAIRCAIRAVLGHPFDDVIADCDKGLSLPSYEPNARSMRGFAFLIFNKPDRAIQEFDIALKARLSGEPLATALVGRGLAKRHIGALEDSAKDIEAAAKTFPRAKQRATEFYRLKD